MERDEGFWVAWLLWVGFVLVLTAWAKVVNWGLGIMLAVAGWIYGYFFWSAGREYEQRRQWREDGR